MALAAQDVGNSCPTRVTDSCRIFKQRAVITYRHTLPGRNGLLLPFTAAPQHQGSSFHVSACTHDPKGLLCVATIRPDSEMPSMTNFPANGVSESLLLLSHSRM
ncbi:hypothetical protein M404DRAFT_995516 [Pisolithus tinctorius Marx 270]|uniref:Uncharacterized protein n=1 Tax=Pisolithus tinctorius Marx 270 TaxID=870435 RepID=A0A0C3PNC6_PISTI|nr:hypothetical protein M404DRAFT_995516 [Pisolithus tinctorius Marx 270]